MVKATDRDQEKHHLNIIEYVDPLLSFRSLSADIKHAVCEVSRLKHRLADARRSQPCSEDILIVWEVVFGEEAVDVAEVAARVLVLAP